MLARGVSVSQQVKSRTNVPVVPYIAAWSAERGPRARVVGGPYGIGYADEQPYDRDAHGVLWTRSAIRRGVGKPELGRVHPARQRRAMRLMLCQVCGNAADRTEEGALWLLKDDRGVTSTWPEDLGATHPPVCVPCATESVRRCPHLRGQFVAVRVRRSVVHGVHGIRYRPTGRGPVPEPEGVTVAYTDPAVRWVRAFQLVRRLNECTVIELRG
ncbi:hypothetical protein CK485_27835 [Streptomyces sp. ICBB 8177]|nr:hypothetical protein CK485_27835 [Streptomyces sp. ICBB 8177]